MKSATENMESVGWYFAKWRKMADRRGKDKISLGQPELETGLFCYPMAIHLLFKEDNVPPVWEELLWEKEYKTDNGCNEGKQVGKRM